MALVLDASIAAAWCLPDEKADLADAVQDRLIEDRAIAPRLFWYEIRNFLVRQERRKRILPLDTTKILADLQEMSIGFEEPESAHVLTLARTYGLTVCDASYLSLAVSYRMPLATLDRALAAAARRAGVVLFAA